MDGTLVDSTAVVEEMWSEFAGQYALDLTVLLEYAHGRRTRETVAKFLPVGRDVDAATSLKEEQQLDRLDNVIEIPDASGFLTELGQHIR